ncbi:MAG: hypothetical protein OHK0039_29280 [Bacteroidia bacterium]
MKNVLLTGALLLGSLAALAQNILTVDNNPLTAAQYTDLQAAVDAASPGDFIYIYPSETQYATTLTLDKEVHLRGVSHFPGQVNAIGDLNLVDDPTSPDDASNASVSGLWINRIRTLSGTQNNIRIANCRLAVVGEISPSGPPQGNGWIIEGCVLINASGPLAPISAPGGLNWVIHHNIIQRTTNSALIQNLSSTALVFNNLFIMDFATMVNNAPNVHFQNCMFWYTGNSGTFFYTASSGVSFTNCLTYAPVAGSFAALPGSNNLDNVNPLFVSVSSAAPQFSYSHDYRLAPGSPAIGAGTNGDDIGIYDGNYDFLQRGYAADLPYVRDFIILNPAISIGSGDSLRVGFEAIGN